MPVEYLRIPNRCEYNPGVSGECRLRSGQSTRWPTADRKRTMAHDASGPAVSATVRPGPSATVRPGPSASVRPGPSTSVGAGQLATVRAGAGRPTPVRFAGAGSAVRPARRGSCAEATVTGSRQASARTRPYAVRSDAGESVSVRAARAHTTGAGVTGPTAPRPTPAGLPAVRTISAGAVPVRAARAPIR